MSTLTGPIIRSESTRTYYKYQLWWRQGKPYLNPLPYRLIRRYFNPTSHAPNGTPSALSYDAFTSPAKTAAYNKAYADFKEKVGDAASLAVNVAERKQAIDAMVKRVVQLTKFTRALAGFRFGEAAKALELIVVSESNSSVRFKRSNHSKNSSWDRAVAKEQRKSSFAKSDPLAPVSGQMQKRTPPRYHKEDDSWEVFFKRNAANFGSNYLEYHFGWEPLMKDIQASWNLFMDPMRDKVGMKIVGKGSSFYQSPVVNHDLYSSWTDFAWKTSCSIRARVKIQNMDLYRLEQLGLLNPPVLFWELIPFSFIADWFFNVGDYLASMTDFLGLELKFPSVSTVSRIGESMWYMTRPLSPPYTWYKEERGSYFTYVQERVISISGPILAPKGIKLPSVTRGLTAISLLTGLYETVQPRKSPLGRFPY